VTEKIRKNARGVAILLECWLDGDRFVEDLDLDVRRAVGIAQPPRAARVAPSASF
jgi:hypothetical protein